MEKSAHRQMSPSYVEPNRKSSVNEALLKVGVLNGDVVSGCIAGLLRVLVVSTWRRGVAVFSDVSKPVKPAPAFSRDVSPLYFCKPMTSGRAGPCRGKRASQRIANDFQLSPFHHLLFWVFPGNIVTPAIPFEFLSPVTAAPRTVPMACCVSRSACWACASAGFGGTQYI
eukprot:gene23184-biopygen23811